MRARAMMLSVLLLGSGGCERTVPDGMTASAGAESARSASKGMSAEAEGGDVDWLALLRAPAEPGFAQVTGPAPLTFPADFGPHQQFRHEWWYFTGRLQGTQGEFGFELTFFRFALAPPADASAGPRTSVATPAPASAPALASAPIPVAGLTASKWRARELYAAHFAVTDLPRGRFHSAVRTARAALGLSGAGSSPLQVWVRDWSLVEQVLPDAADEGLQGGALPRWTLRAADADYALSLDLRAASGPVLNGDAGFSRKAEESGAASEYYSIPRLAAHGTLWRAAQPQAVSGEVWLDREWGSGVLGAGQEGWDWFALQLDDGSALMFYALRRHGGAYDLHSAGTWVDAGGRPQPLAAADVQIDVRDHWLSPRGGRYPAGWQLRVPRLQLLLAIHPVLADQELEAVPRYWEGAVDATGTRGARSLTGRGYVELVGYASAAQGAGPGQ